MEKENLIKFAEHLYQSALDANAYYAIMMQYREMRKKYEDEMKISPAFYQVVYGALQKACFMEVAKLYDATDVSMKQLLQCCRDNRALFPEYRDIVMVKEDDREYFFQVPYQYHLNSTEECFFENEAKIKRELCKVFEAPDFEKAPMKVDLTFSELLDVWQKRFHSLNKKQKNIRVQRNKIYAHNDKEYSLEDEKIWDKNPVTYPEVKDMIDFALDCTRLILEILTGENHAENYGNIDDIEETLILVKLGLQYQGERVEQEHQKIMKEIYVDKKK